MRRAELRGDLEIPAHAHGKDVKAVPCGNLRKKGEMRRRRFKRGRNAHQSLDREAEFLAALPDETVSLLRQDACLLRLCACIDLNQKTRPAALPPRLLRERPGDLGAIDRFDDIKEGDRLAGLVGLEGADETKFDVWKLRLEGQPLALRLLDPVFAENPLTGRERFPQLLFAMRFRYGDDLDSARSSCFPERRAEPRADGGEVGRKAGGNGMSDISAHESLRMRAAKLAAAAAALKRESGDLAAPFSLVFLTDRRRIAHPEPVMRALPKGAAVIYRDYDDPKRAAVASRYAAICNRRGVLFFVGGDQELALRAGADGVHLPARMLKNFRRNAAGLLTAACHDAGELRLAAGLGADAAILSPVFATASHPYTDYLGAASFRALAAGALLPVLALGGVDEQNARLLAGRNVAGIGAIGAFLP